MTHQTQRLRATRRESNRLQESVINHLLEPSLPAYRYIFDVLPSSSGMASSGDVVGYVTGICMNMNMNTRQCELIITRSHACCGLETKLIRGSFRRSSSVHAIHTLLGQLTSNSRSNSYFTWSRIVQHLPNHLRVKIIGSA